MNLKKSLCVLVVLCAVLVLIVSVSPVRAEGDTDEDETRTAQFLPYGTYGLYGSPYASPYGLQYPSYAAYGGLYPYGGVYPYGSYGLGMNPFGFQNIYYSVPLQGTGYVFQAPYVQIAPYLGATTFWQNQFPNADWSNVLAAQFLGLIDLSGMPRLF